MVADIIANNTILQNTNTRLTNLEQDNAVFKEKFTILEKTNEMMLDKIKN